MIELVEVFGNDLMVVNAARVSMDKYHPEIDSKTDPKLIKYLAKNGHWCYDDKTEIFTQQGWKLFKDLLKTDQVAQVEPETWKMAFVTPQQIHDDPYEGPMYLNETSTVNYCVTPGHKMLYQDRDKIGYRNWVVKTSDECYGKIKRFRTTATLECLGKGSHDEGAYTGFLLGDGFRVNSITVGVRLKKSRKISYFQEILDTLKYVYTLKITSQGVTQFSIKDNFTNLAKCSHKYIPDLTDKSSEYMRGLLEGLMESDGSVKHKGWAFSSSSRKLFDGVLDLATRCGFNVFETSPRHFDNPNYSINYRCTLSSRHHAQVQQKEDIISYKGRVYCVTVPTGFVLVRRKNKQMVCGNTPFSHPRLQFRVTVPIFIARQWTRSVIGTRRTVNEEMEMGTCIEAEEFSDFNEVSRRYVDSDPEFYQIEQYRKRPDKSIKQGSGADLDSESNLRMQSLAKDLECHARNLYDEMLDSGVAPEQARAHLPQTMLTQWVETSSLAFWARFCTLRQEGHAQKEIQMEANKISELIKPWFPISWPILMGNSE